MQMLAAQSAQKVHRVTKGVAPKENPGQNDVAKRNRDAQQARQTFLETQPKRPVNHQGHAVQATPNNEVPGRAVPKPGEHEAKTKIRVTAHRGNATPTQRDVEVFFNPG